METILTILVVTVAFVLFLFPSITNRGNSLEKELTKAMEKNASKSIEEKIWDFYDGKRIDKEVNNYFENLSDEKRERLGFKWVESITWHIR